MGLCIDLHKVTKTEIRHANRYENDGDVFFAQDIIIHFAGGQMQTISLYSDVSADALAPTSGERPEVPAA